MSETKTIALTETFKFHDSNRTSFVNAKHSRLVILTDCDPYSCTFSFGGRRDNVCMTLHQSFLDFCIQFSKNFAALNEKENTKNTLPSIHIHPFKTRMTYRPAPTTGMIMTPELQSVYLSWIPITNAAIKIPAVDFIGGTKWTELFELLGEAVFQDRRNILRIISGIKGVKATTDVLRNISELVLIPLIPGGNQNEGIIHRLQSQTTKTLVSVLDIGSANERSSIRHPQGLREGMIKAAESTKTAIALIGGNGEVSLLDIPGVVVAPLSNVLTGVCNQLDPKR